MFDWILRDVVSKNTGAASNELTHMERRGHAAVKVL